MTHTTIIYQVHQNAAIDQSSLPSKRLRCPCTLSSGAYPNRHGVEMEVLQKAQNTHFAASR